MSCSFFIFQKNYKVIIFLIKECEGFGRLRQSHKLINFLVPQRFHRRHDEVLLRYLLRIGSNLLPRRQNVIRHFPRMVLHSCLRQYFQNPLTHHVQDVPLVADKTRMCNVFAAGKYAAPLLLYASCHKLHLQQAAFCYRQYCGYPPDHQSW